MSNDDKMALAQAMAIRQGKIEATSDKVAAGLMGVPYDPPTAEQVMEQHLGPQLMLINLIDNPNASVQLENMFIVDLDHGVYAEDFADLFEDGEVPEPNPEGQQQVAEAYAKEFRQSFDGDLEQMIAQDFADLLNSARQLATERGVPVTDVYINDDLYYEASRRAMTLEQRVERFCKIMNIMSGDMVTRIAVTQVENLLPQGAVDAMTTDELNDYVINMQIDPAAQMQAEMDAEFSKECLRWSCEYVLTTMYGDDVYDRLTDEQRQALTPRTGSLPDYVDFTD